MLQQAVRQVLSKSTPTTLALLSRQLHYSAVHRVTEVQLTADSSTASPAACAVVLWLLAWSREDKLHAGRSLIAWHAPQRVCRVAPRKG
jgi:hypothetical protein